MSIFWESSSATHTGKVRKHNEDSLLDKPEYGLWVIADGMGGHDAGDFASRLIVKTIDKLAVDDDIKTFCDKVKTALYSINDYLIRLGEKHNRMNGSTALAMLLTEDNCYFVWAGDSRLYLYRDNQLTQLTKDHSQAEVYVELGMLTREEASRHVSSNLLTRCIGIDENLELETGYCDVKPGDRFLLSSDGLDKHVSHEDIEQKLSQTNREEAIDELIEMALKDGGTDNISVVIIDTMAK